VGANTGLRQKEEAGGVKVGRSEEAGGLEAQRTPGARAWYGLQRRLEAKGGQRHRGSEEAGARRSEEAAASGLEEAGAGRRRRRVVTRGGGEQQRVRAGARERAPTRMSGPVREFFHVKNH
jgi:hypothetical protein